MERERNPGAVVPGFRGVYHRAGRRPDPVAPSGLRAVEEKAPWPPRGHDRDRQVMRLSEAAAGRIRDIIGKSERPIAGVRVGVQNGGCAGMSYMMEYAEAIDPRDEIVNEKGVRLFIDPKAGAFPFRHGNGLSRR